MSGTRRSPILRYLHKFLGAAAAGAVTDAELLQRFAAARDEAAFELLLCRHGAMVHTVCRQVLRDADAAEDAFQATFLVLVRKARSISRREALGGYLYRVAYRIALRARTRKAKQAAVERPGLDLSRVPGPADPGDTDRQDLRRLLYEEVDRLPAKYRAPVVLCYFESRTHEEAARQLGWPKGTVSGRLARARELLRKRLTRRGVPLTVGLLAAALSPGPAPAARLAGAAAEAARLFTAGKAAGPGVISARAVLLAEGVLKAMLWTKIKITTALLLAVTAAGLVGLVGRTFPARQPGGPAAAPRPETPPRAEGREAPGRDPGAGAREKEPEDRLRFARNLARSLRNLKQLALAMHNYNDTYIGLPAPAIYEGEMTAGGAMGAGMMPGRMRGMPGMGQMGGGMRGGAMGGTGFSGGMPGMGPMPGIGPMGGGMRPGADSGDPRRLAGSAMPGGRPGAPGGAMPMPGGGLPGRPGGGMPGGLPGEPARGQEGKALLSWRVTLLPYLEQQRLYQQFHLNEPWDSPHNLPLLKQMPEVYAPPGAPKAKPYATFYQVFVGESAVFQKHQHASLPGITDGTSNTILIVESGTAVPWTKPEDLHYAPDEPLPELGGLFPDVFNAAFADGSVWTLKKGCAEQTLRRAIDPADGQPTDLEKCKAVAAQRLAEFVGKGETELEQQNKALQDQLRRAREQVEHLKAEKEMLEVVAREKAKLGKDTADPLAKENAQLRQALRQVQADVERLTADVERLRGRKGPAPAERPAVPDSSAELERLQRRLDEQARRSREETERLQDEIRRLRQGLKK